MHRHAYNDSSRSASRHSPEGKNINTNCQGYKNRYRDCNRHCHPVGFREARVGKTT